MMQKIVELKSDLSNTQKAIYNLIGPISVRCDQKVHTRPNSKSLYVYETITLRTNENKNDSKESFSKEVLIKF